MGRPIDISKRMGWLGVDVAKAEWDKLCHLFPEFEIKGKIARPKSMNLCTLVKKMNGSYYTFVNQGSAGTCVGAGMKNAGDTLQFVEMALNKDFDKFEPLCLEYHYGCGRVFIGGGRLDGDDGSVGSWQAKAVEQFGTIFETMPNIGPYSISRARKWGNRPGPPQDLVNVGKKYLIKTTTQVNNWDNLCDAIANGYPVTVASDQGFNMMAGSDGFHKASGSWAHQMFIYAYFEDGTNDHALIGNSWGDAHGQLKDWETGEELPKGTIRARRSVIERMLRQEDSFAISQHVGLPGQVDKILEKLAQDSWR